MSLLVEVAVPVPLLGALTYRVPERHRKRMLVGVRVVCPLGKRPVVGVVLKLTESDAARDEGNLKDISRVLDDVPILNGELLGFLVRLADYYFAPIGEVVRLALPALERSELRQVEDEVVGQRDLFDRPKVSRTKSIAIGEHLVAHACERDDVPPLRGQALAVLAKLKEVGDLPVTELEAEFSNARAALRRLTELGFTTMAAAPRPEGAIFSEDIPRDAPPHLFAAQAAAVEKLTAAISTRTNSAFLLFGITGSGKTEVYLHAIERALACGSGALVMVPEIALTPQLVGRFRARFGDEVAVVHSALSERSRHAMWQRLHKGELRVAIGARSALFAPVRDLGLVIVDEEHDGSFKQEEGVRYHARDMALLRSHLAGAVIVLGSATPSIESISLAERGKLELLRLPERAGKTAVLPEVRLIDLRKVGAGPTGDPLISLPLHRAIEATVTRKEQAIIFLNRRGFAPSIICKSCGNIERCPSCSVSLTFHRRKGAPCVRCHYCGFEAKEPERCGACGAGSPAYEGLGTEQLEENIANAFPSARVARLDRDVASGRQAEGILARMRDGEIDILVGTQMVTKGHDLPNVTLVGVINADSALSMPDFRAGERTFQLLVQVAGRAGRHELKGEVLIQTRSPDHPAIALAAKHDVEGFLAQEREDRELTRYPPAARLALLRVDAMEDDLARDTASALAEAALALDVVKDGEVEVMGPSSAPLARLRGRFRHRVLLRADERAPLREAVARLLPTIKAVDRRVRAIVDIDPYSML